MNQAEEMRTQGITRLLINFSIPAILAMVVNAVYNVVDRIFVGIGVGQIAIAATQVAFPIMILIMAVSLLISIGATALISIRLGENKKEEAELIASNALFLMILLPLGMAAIYYPFADALLTAFGASAEVLPYARDFMHVIMIGAVFFSVSIGVNNFIRAEGNPRMAMFTQILGAVINVILNYIFIFQLGMGIKGSALSTVIAQFVSASVVITYFFTPRSVIKFKIKNFKLRKSIVLRVASIGFAPFALQMANSLQMYIINTNLRYYGGDIALAAIGIMLSISTMIFMPILGISQGAQPIIGFNYGAKQIERVKETMIKAIIFGSCVALFGYIILHVWTIEIVSFFVSKQDQNFDYLMQLTPHAIRIFFATFPFVALQVIGSTYFQATGKAMKATVLSLSRQVLIFIPFLLILPKYLGIEGIWWASPISDILSVMITSSFLYVEWRRLSDHSPERIRNNPA